VFTSLTKEALPVIRYRTRDLTRLLPGTARSMRRMEKVTVRVEARDAHAGTEERRRLAAELAGHVKHTIGVTVSVDVVEPNVLGRSSGKLNRILDER
jgi:phenylacetate-CoA ligase